MFLRVLVRFLARHPTLQTNPILIVGESYGGTRATLMLDYLYNYAALSGTTAAYRDADLASDLKTYFSAVFGTETPTTAQIATKFGKQVLIEPVVVGSIQQAKNSGQDKSVCLTTSYDDYFCNKPANWFNEKARTANENMLRISTLTTALGVNPKTIEWMKASSRTQAYGRTRDQVVSAPEMVAAFGTLNTDDNYFLSHNTDVGNGYVVSTNPTVYSRSWFNSGPSIGTSFLSVLQNVTTLITYAKFDTVVWTPAIPQALRDSAFSGLVSSVAYSATQSNGLDRPGLVTVTYSSGSKRAFPLPLYEAGHTVTMLTPADFLNDVKKWYLSPPTASALSAMSSTDMETTDMETSNAPAAEGSTLTPAAAPVAGAPHPYIGP
jgi:hypothetical protein